MQIQRKVRTHADKPVDRLRDIRSRKDSISLEIHSTVPSFTKVFGLVFAVLRVLTRHLSHLFEHRSACQTLALRVLLRHICPDIPIDSVVHLSAVDQRASPME